MKTNIKDLEVLQKYLSEEELKEVAKQVAYESFRNSMGSGNPNNKSNIDFYAKYGAYEAVKQHITDGGFREEEFVDELRERVKGIIKRLSRYDVPLDSVVEEILEEKRDEVRVKVDDVWKEWVSKEEDDFGSLYSCISRSGADYISEYIIETFENSLKDKFQSKKD